MKRSARLGGGLAVAVLSILTVMPVLADADVRTGAPDTGTRLQRTDLEHFTLWSERALSDKDLYSMRQNLQNVRREVGRDFGGYFPTSAFNVVLTRVEVFRAYSKSPGHVSGLFDGTIHVPLRTEGGPEQVKAVLHHEYTHALLWLASGGKCPSWIHEAFAVDQEERVNPRRTIDASQIAPGGRLFRPLSDLEANLIPDPQNPRSNELAYQEAWAVALFLRSKYKPAKLLDWIRQMERSESWEAAARRTLGMDAEDLERETARFLTKHAN